MDAFLDDLKQRLECKIVRFFESTTLDPDHRQADDPRLVGMIYRTSQVGSPLPTVWLNSKLIVPLSGQHRATQISTWTLYITGVGVPPS